MEAEVFLVALIVCLQPVSRSRYWGFMYLHCPHVSLVKDWDIWDFIESLIAADVLSENAEGLRANESGLIYLSQHQSEQVNTAITSCIPSPS